MFIYKNIWLGFLRRMLLYAFNSNQTTMKVLFLLLLLLYLWSFCLFVLRIFNCLLLDSMSQAPIRKFWIYYWRKNVTTNVYCRLSMVSRISRKYGKHPTQRLYNSITVIGSSYKGKLYCYVSVLLELSIFRVRFIYILHTYIHSYINKCNKCKYCILAWAYALYLCSTYGRGCGGTRHMSMRNECSLC